MIAVRTSPRRTFGPRCGGGACAEPTKPRISLSHGGGPPGRRPCRGPCRSSWGQSAPGQWCPISCSLEVCSVGALVIYRRSIAIYRERTPTNQPVQGNGPICLARPAGRGAGALGHGRVLDDRREEGGRAVGVGDDPV